MTAQPGPIVDPNATPEHEEGDRRSILPRLNLAERLAIYKQVRRNARSRSDFFVMIALAAGIAGLGLRLDSPTTIVGAMIISPLMATIVGLGLGVIHADGKLLLISGNTLLRGMLLAGLMGVLVGLAIPGAEPTGEIMARTAPSLFDLGVALLSGMAGAYALCRPNVSSALAGVAIAVALVPPLVTVGIGLAWFEWAIAGGALLLFLTNLVAICAASELIFLLVGFRPNLDQQGDLTVFIGSIFSSVILFVLVGGVLGQLTVSHFQEVTLEKMIKQTLTSEIHHLNPAAQLSEWRQVRQDDGSLKVEILVRSPRGFSYEQVVDLQNRVATAVQQPLALVLQFVPITELNPVIPPTPTPSPTFTPTPTPGPSPTPSPTDTPTLTPTPSPTLTPTPTASPTTTPSATPSPTATFTPAPTPTPVPAVIAFTGGRGVKLRWQPNGLVAGTLAEGVWVLMLNEQISVDWQTWVKVTDQNGRTGWVVQDYLSTYTTQPK
ncbi:MAG: hypothetical protein BroJett011_74870 [Chloroflexota bacterium]|nr:MAG: hypothetical protein BroJett011_74870 [Chloroflexota bacterium]